MSKPKIISIPQLGAIADALADLTKTLRERGKEEDCLTSQGPDEEHVKYLEKKLDRYEKAVFKIINPMFDAGVPYEVIKNIIEGEGTVSVFYDKNQRARSAQHVDIRFTAIDVEGE